MSAGSSLEIAATALTAQRLRMDVIASNIANAETTRIPSGGPYRRSRVVFSAAPVTSPAWGELQGTLGQSWQAEIARTTYSRSASRANPTGVVVTGIVEDPSKSRTTYDPNHPDADADGYVAYPNVDLVTEMADMLSATRAYEASVTIVNASKGMALKALEIGRG